MQIGVVYPQNELRGDSTAVRLPSYTDDAAVWTVEGLRHASAHLVGAPAVHYASSG
jgi:hypothetical protein